MTRVLLTGRSGFIGRRLLAHLRRAGIDVISLGRRPEADEHHLVVSSLDASVIDEALGTETIDAVLHLAAAGVHPGDRDADALRQINALLPSALVATAASRGARAFVMTGSNSEYARYDGDRLDESAPLETMKLYGTTKAAGGMLAVAAGEAVGVPTINLRLFNVYGPGEAAHRLLPSLRTALGAGHAVPLSEGTQLRDFIHVDDACGAIMAALRASIEGSLTGGHYNVASGVPTSVKAFALEVAASMKVDTSLLRFGALPLRPDDQPRVIGDASRFICKTGWQPHISVAQGVASTLAESSLLETAGLP